MMERGLVAVPCTEILWTQAAVPLFGALRSLPDSVDVRFDWCSLPTIEKRNHLVRRFLKENSYQWLVFIDSDMVPEADSVDQLIRAGLGSEYDILGAHCYARHHIPFRPCGGWFNGTQVTWIDEFDGAVREVDWVGTGCVFIRRSVLQALVDRHGASGAFSAPKNLSWTGRGEDQEFCRKAGELGFKIGYHTGIRFGHVGLQEIRDELVDRIDQGSPLKTRSCEFLMDAKHGGEGHTSDN